MMYVQKGNKVAPASAEHENKVYIVTTGDYGKIDVAGVYSSKFLAAAQIEEAGIYLNKRILEFELDAPFLFGSFNVWIDTDGDIYIEYSDLNAAKPYAFFDSPGIIYIRFPKTDKSKVEDIAAEIYKRCVDGRCADDVELEKIVEEVWNEFIGGD